MQSFFCAMAAQTKLSDEIVIVDGGSTDGSWEFLQSQIALKQCAIVVLQEKGCNVARGRNLAIAQASHDIIVSTDMGCAWEPAWLRSLTQPFCDQPETEVVIGSWGVRPVDLKTPWAKTEWALKGPMQLNATPDSLGISRSIAYKKYVWEAVGGYPEDLTLAADDVVFDALLKKGKFKTVAVSTVLCYWMRHETLSQYCREERRNFMGAGEAAIWRKHFVLVAGRLGWEVIGVVLALVLLAFHANVNAAVVLILVALSVGHRFWRLRPAVQRLRQMGVDQSWWRLVEFEYLTKLYGMWGYAKGYLRGVQHCRDCRQRLWAN
ncbi:glycosyltransferase [filamentous cyanobacterium LEGE 07170]|nr:glycosyltransferase [filamentous cyanobacterium LEGE 07170]